MKLYDVIRKEKLGDNQDQIIERVVINKPQSNVRIGKTKISIKKISIIGLIIVLLAIIYIVGVKFVHARVTIVERRVPFSLNNEELELAHEKDASSERLSFQTMVVSTEVSREVYGSSVEPSISSAKGLVVFFNEYSKSAQTVKAKTTITAQNGKKYQTQSSVKVPGYTTSGNVKTPGTSTPVSITAVSTGPSYNNPGTSFSVSGWNSKQFYAQSSGSITGGEDGVFHVVSNSDKDKVISTLQAQLTERLKRETRTQIPDNLITFPDLQFVTIDASSMVLKGESIRFPASIKGTMVTYLISRKLLENAIAASALTDQKYPNVSIPNISDLTITPKTAIPTNPDSVPESIVIKISGQGTIIAKAPMESIRESLIGIQKKNFEKVLLNIPEIDTSKFNLYPFWSPLFPAKESNINVIVK